MDQTLFASHMDVLASLVGVWNLAPFCPPSAERPQLAVTFDDGYKDTLAQAAPIMIERGIPLTVFITAANLRSPGGLYLNQAELKELSQLPGVLIGAHGNNHIPLTGLEDGRLHSELSGSREALEDLLGLPVTTLSYPHGSVDRRVRDAAQEAGYRLGGCSCYGLNTPERDPLLLYRTELTAYDTVEDLLLKVDGHWDWYRLRHPDPAAR
jgi:peptidoglycan/xylan/chitin deacetylase (PgdA/CDA1 family)